MGYRRLQMPAEEDHQAAVGADDDRRVGVIVHIERVVNRRPLDGARIVIVGRDHDVAGAVHPTDISPFVFTLVIDRPRIGEPAPPAVVGDAHRF